LAEDAPLLERAQSRARFILVDEFQDANFAQIKVLDKLAGTERGLGSEPQATFSACFGAPFLPRPALEYARMLGEKMRKHDVKCFLVNTGWVGGAFGVGERMNLKYTRAMVNAAIAGELPNLPHWNCGGRSMDRAGQISLLKTLLHYLDTRTTAMRRWPR